MSYTPSVYSDQFDFSDLLEQVGDLQRWQEEQKLEEQNTMLAQQVEELRRVCKDLQDTKEYMRQLSAWLNRELQRIRDYQRKKKIEWLANSTAI